MSITIRHRCQQSGEHSNRVSVCEIRRSTVITVLSLMFTCSFLAKSERESSMTDLKLFERSSIDEQPDGRSSTEDRALPGFSSTEDLVDSEDWREADLESSVVRRFRLRDLRRDSSSKKSGRHLLSLSVTFTVSLNDAKINADNWTTSWVVAYDVWPFIRCLYPLQIV